jgi:hypothetical protein
MVMTVMGFSLLLPRQQQEHLSVLVQIYVFPPYFHHPILTFSVPQHTVPLPPSTLAALPSPSIGEYVRGVVVQQVFVVVAVAVVAVVVVRVR